MWLCTSQVLYSQALHLGHRHPRTHLQQGPYMPKQKGFSPLSQRDLKTKTARWPSGRWHRQRRARDVSMTGRRCVFKITQLRCHSGNAARSVFPTFRESVLCRLFNWVFGGGAFSRALRSHRAVGDWPFAGPLHEVVTQCGTGRRLRVSGPCFPQMLWVEAVGLHRAIASFIAFSKTFILWLDLLFIVF